MTTMNTFVNNLADLSITGVKRNYDGAPSNVESADLPALFPRAVEGSDGAFTHRTYGGWQTLVCELVILVEKVGLDTVPQNHQKVVDVIDNANAALWAAVDVTKYGKSRLSWDWALSSDEVVGETVYWAVVFRVEGAG